MKVINIALQPAGQGQTVIGFAAVQKREGSRWITTDIFQLRTGDPSQSRQMLLEDDERIIIQGTSNVEQKYDPDQFSVKEVIGPVQGDFEVKDLALPPGPITPKAECQTGVWRVGADQDWSRTGSRYRIY